MSEAPELLVPASGGTDHLHAAVRATLAAIPFAGGGAVEVFNAILTPPIEKRRNQWMENVSRAIGTLCQHNAAIVERITGDEQFQSVLIQATWVAIRNHQQEKLDALRNVVLNSAEGTNFSVDRQLLFVRYIDELTPSHLQVLREMIATQTTISNAESYQDLLDQLAPRMAEPTTPTFFKLVCVDLQSRGLIRISREVSDFPGLFEQGMILLEQHTEGPRLLVTDLGQDFLSHVTRNHEGVIP
jgi:hypothetical protein